MAIKVGGTDVISNARALTNIASIDATTAASISAAGVGGGGEADFVASGAIANGDVVILNSNGTVSVVTGETRGVGTAITIASGLFGGGNGVVYDSSSGKILVAPYGRKSIYVGTISGTSITFGAENSWSGTSSAYESIVYDSTNNKVVVAYRDGGNSNYGTAVVGTVSGTSVTFGTPVVFNSAQTDWIDATYDSTNSKIVIVFADGGFSPTGTAMVGTVSGTSISFGSETHWASGFQYSSITYDPTNQKMVISYKDNSASNVGKVVVGTVSGTSISVGSEVTFNSGATQDTRSAFDPSTNKILLTYRDDVTGEGEALVGTVSGTSISFGSPVVFESNNATPYDIVYDSTNQKMVLAWRGNDGSYYGKINTAAISGTSVSFETAATISSANAVRIGLAYDTVNEKTAIFYGEFVGSWNGKSSVFTYGSTNASSYIGIAAEAISNTATGAITIDGGVNEGQTGLTIGSTYYVADDGSLSTTNNGRKIGRAISATKILVDSAMSGDEMNTYLGSLV